MSKTTRFLSGTTSVLFASWNDSMENPGVRPFSKKVEIRKLIRSFLDVY
jgi:hypothetical protein